MSLVDAFSAHFSTVGGEVVVDQHASPAAIIAGFLVPSTPILVAPMLTIEHPDLYYDLVSRGFRATIAQDAATVRDAPVGITCARSAIAETGSLLLDERDIADRAVSMLVRHLIVICHISNVVTSLDDAAPILRDIGTRHGSFATFVSGPSRTADIERELAIGVQGPARVTVVFSEALA